MAKATADFSEAFGLPDRVGALLARPEALAKLHRPWFAGGTITVASVTADRHCVAAESTGAVWVSLGLASDFSDVEAFLDLARGFSIEAPPRRGPPLRYNPASFSRPTSDCAAGSLRVGASSWSGWTSSRSG